MIQIRKYSHLPFDHISFCPSERSPLQLIEHIPFTSTPAICEQFPWYILSPFTSLLLGCVFTFCSSCERLACVYLFLLYLRSFCCWRKPPSSLASTVPFKQTDQSLPVFLSVTFSPFSLAKNKASNPCSISLLLSASHHWRLPSDFGFHKWLYGCVDLFSAQ